MTIPDIPRLRRAGSWWRSNSKEVRTARLAKRSSAGLLTVRFLHSHCFRVGGMLLCQLPGCSSPHSAQNGRFCSLASLHFPWQGISTLKYFRNYSFSGQFRFE